MAKKKSIEELDAELAELEAELASLESGAGAPAPPKPKRGRKAPPEEAPEPDATEEAAEPAAAEPEPAPRPKRKFGLPGRKAREEPEAPAEAAAEAPEAAPADAPPVGRRKFGLPRRKAAEAPDPEAAPEAPPAEDEPLPPPPPPAAPAMAWKQEGAGWRAPAAGTQRVEVMRRKLDASGHVVEEERVGEELVGAPEEAPAPASRFGFLRRRGAADEPAPDEPLPEGEEPPRRRRGWLLPLAVVLVLVVVGGALAFLSGGFGGGGAAPVAAFTASTTVAAVQAPVVFDAGTSSDPGNRPLEFSWDFGDGSGAQGDRVTHSYAARGTYVVTLTVRNDAGRTATAAQNLTIVPPPQARIAATLGGSPLGAGNQPLAGESVAFDAAGSTGEGLAAYEWNFGDGTARATGAQVQHAFAAPGAYRVVLTVADRQGLRANATLGVYVGAGETIAGEAPASLQQAQAVNHTLTVQRGGGVLPYAPARLVATLTYNATGPGALPVPLPVDPNALTLTIYDAAGAVVATQSGAETTKTLEVTDFSGALGAWSVEVSRAQGGAQPLPYTLDVRLQNGPA